MINVVAIDHLVLRTVDPEPMLHFYCDLLGCEVERRVAAIGLIQLRAGRSQIDLVQVDPNDSNQPDVQSGANLEHFCLRIDAFNEQALRAFLEENGVATEPAQRRFGADGFGPSIYIADPQGNTVELKGPPEP